VSSDLTFVCLTWPCFSNWTQVLKKQRKAWKGGKIHFPFFIAFNIVHHINGVMQPDYKDTYFPLCFFCNFLTLAWKWGNLDYVTSGHSCNKVLKCFTIMYGLVWIWNHDVSLEHASNLVYNSAWLYCRWLTTIKYVALRQAKQMVSSFNTIGLLNGIKDILILIWQNAGQQA
jgi:hypothetical protein